MRLFAAAKPSYREGSTADAQVAQESDGARLGHSARLEHIPAVDVGVKRQVVATGHDE